MSPATKVFLTAFVLIRAFGLLLRAHPIPPPFSHLMRLVFIEKHRAVAIQPRGCCWLQNPWRKAFHPPASEPVSIGRGTICLKWRRWFHDPDHAAVLHRAWFIDNPSAYMFLQHKIGCGKRLPIGWGGGGGVSSQWKIISGTMIAFSNSSSFDLMVAVHFS